MQTELFAPRQTNTGLYVQLHQLGFAVGAIQEAQKAYRLACRLFNGRYRKTERAFICHAIGTASSVAHFDTRISYVLAAMLHAAYDCGQFPDGRIGGSSAHHRAWMVAQIGPEVESIMFRYSSFRFEMGEPERYVRDGFNDADQDLLFMALAHEVDDLLDLGLMFAVKYGPAVDARVDACATLAGRIGRPELASTLRAHGLLYKDCEWTDDLTSVTMHGFHVVPRVMAYLRYRFSHFRARHVHLH